MDTRTADRRLTDRGVTSVQFVASAALGLLVFLALANLVVVQYGRGALRSALDQGVREGAVSGSLSRCEVRLDEVIDQLLGGLMREQIEAGCYFSGPVVMARGRAVFESWTPFSGDFVVELSASAVAEGAP